jgi:uncharacterized protein YqeY
MKSINELTKESMQLRNSDPVRAKVLKMLIGDAKKIAKEAQREATEADLLSTARRQVKETENAIAMIRQGGGDTTEYEAELAILRDFLPPALDAAAIEAAVDAAIASLPAEDRNKKSMGKIMGLLKDVEGMDMKQASAMLGRKLA